ADNLTRRWNGSSPAKPLSEFKNDGSVIAVVVRGDSHRIASATADGVRIWDESGKQVAQINGDPRRTAQVAKIDAEIVFTKGVISRTNQDLNSYEGLIRITGVTKDEIKKAEDARTAAQKTRDDKKAALEKVKADNETNKEKIASEKAAKDKAEMAEKN